MKVIIAGSRVGFSYEDFCAAVRHAIKGHPEFKNITEVVQGGAIGVDHYGQVWANLKQIPVKCFPAKWALYGKSAGYKRNEEMADYVSPDGGLIAVWDGKSKGTKHMIDIAQRKNLLTFVYMPEVKDPIKMYTGILRENGRESVEVF